MAILVILSLNRACSLRQSYKVTLKGTEMANNNLDTTDWRILDILQGDAAIPNIDLADKVFLSPSPCSRRVKNLEDKG